MNKFPIIIESIELFKKHIEENFALFLDNKTIELKSEIVGTEKYKNIILTMSDSPISIVVGHEFLNSDGDINPNFSMIQTIPDILDAIKNNKNVRFDEVFINSLPHQNGFVKEAVEATKKHLKIIDCRKDLYINTFIFQGKLTEAITNYNYRKVN